SYRLFSLQPNPIPSSICKPSLFLFLSLLTPQSVRLSLKTCCFRLGEIGDEWDGKRKRGIRGILTHISKEHGCAPPRLAMVFSAALRPILPATSSHLCSKLCYSRLNKRQDKLAFPMTKRRGHCLKVVRAVLNKRKISINDNGPTESAKILLERLFEQTQKLEEQMTQDSYPPEDVQPLLNLEVLESDLQAVLLALKQKEEDLQDAESIVLLEHSQLNCAKEELERRDEEIAAARCKHEQLEEEMKKSTRTLASQARQIEDLKLQLKKRDEEVATTQSSLSLKEEEMEKLRVELVKKIEEASKTDSELKSKIQLLNEANEVIQKQEYELQGLREAIREKEEELEVSLTLKKLEEEKLKAAEANLEKRTMEWLLAQEELNKVAEKASKHARETDETLEDFRRVKKLLGDVRSELVSSQKSLASSRQKMEEQEVQLEKQLTELEERKKNVMSYMVSLKDAQIEVESERVKLRVAQARNKELERDLSMEKELMEELQEELNKERTSLQQAIQDMSLLQEELDRKNTEFERMNNILQVKESESVEAKLEIQHLRSEQAALQLILEEKDMELLNARKKLEGLNQEIGELKMLMNSREDQLILATTMLKEKDDHVQLMKDELNDVKLKFSEANTAVQQIVELTNKLAMSIKDENSTAVSAFDDMGHDFLQQLLEKPTDGFSLQKRQVETELKLTRESLRMKEIEVLAVQRALTLKDEELRTVIGRLDAREKELKMLKEELNEDANDPRKLYALAQERIGDGSIGDLALEKLQLEAAQLEVEAATCALSKLIDMGRQLLNKASVSLDADNDASVLPQDDSDTGIDVVGHSECLTEVKYEVERLSALTEQLVQEAGIA
ncbi:hypothetical protein F2P56_026192, partial [Juglans regia]